MNKELTQKGHQMCDVCDRPFILKYHNKDKEHLNTIEDLYCRPVNFADRQINKCVLGFNSVQYMREF